MRVVLAGLLLVLCVGCGSGEHDGERFAIYHLEMAIGSPGTDGELRCGPPRAVCPGIVEQPPPRVVRYAELAAPALTDADIDLTTIRQVADPSTGAPVVVVDLTTAGRVAFARLTKAAARVGERDQGWHHIAIVVDDEIVGFPEIDFDVYPDGIGDARDVWIAAVDEADAQTLARKLRGD